MHQYRCQYAYQYISSISIYIFNINISSGYSCSCGGDYCPPLHLFHLSSCHYWMELRRCVRTQRIHCDFDISPTDLPIAVRMFIKKPSHTKASPHENRFSIKSLLQLVLRVCELLNHRLWRSDPYRRSYCWRWVNNFYKICMTCCAVLCCAVLCCAV